MAARLVTCGAARLIETLDALPRPVKDPRNDLAGRPLDRMRRLPLAAGPSRSRNSGSTSIGKIRPLPALDHLLRPCSSLTLPLAKLPGLHPTWRCIARSGDRPTLFIFVSDEKRRQERPTQETQHSSRAAGSVARHVAPPPTRIALPSRPLANEFGTPAVEALGASYFIDMRGGE